MRQSADFELQNVDCKYVLKKAEDEAASTNWGADAATQDATSQSIEMDSEMEPMECDEIIAGVTFESTVLAFITPGTSRRPLITKMFCLWSFSITSYSMDPTEK